MVDPKDLDYWVKEYPELTREEIIDVLEIIDADEVKEDFWKKNPDLPEEVVDDVVRKNVAASYEYHQYRTFNDEAP